MGRKRGEISGRDIVAEHQALGIGLRAFQQGRLAGRAEDAEAALLELVHDAGDERHFRPDHGQVNAVLDGELEQAVAVGDRQRHALGQLGDPGVARRAEDPAHLRALRQFPDQGVFAPPAADHQNFQHPFSF